MDNKHLNAITLLKNVSAQFISHWLDHSYKRVINKMPKKSQQLIK